MAEDAEPRPYLIPVRRRWTLWILPILAILYFAAVLVIASLNLEVEGVPMETLVLVGVGLFALVLVIELPFLLKRRRPKPRREPEPEPEPAAESPAVENLPPPPPPRPAADDEYFSTTEQQQGYQVLEYSAPAKSARRGAVYAKAYVPVTKEHVLRVETLAAESHEV